jgi:hypothetical protein
MVGLVLRKGYYFNSSDRKQEGEPFFYVGAEFRGRGHNSPGCPYNHVGSR